MFSINRETQLTIEILQKMINKFYVSVLPKLQKNKNYYDGKQDILNKSYTDSTKPCSRIVTNYCRNIADSYCGYLAAPGYISYTSDNDIEAIMNVLKYNDYQSEDADFLLSALTFGVANELMYLDENSQVRFKIIDARTCFGIFDNSLTNDLLYFVRMYKADEWDESNNYKVDVYSDNTIMHYNMTGQNGNLTFVNEEIHYFSQCPANIFYLQDEKAIFECIESLQDAVNELLSCEVDDYSAFCDAYLTLTGVDAEAEDIAQMKENRVLVLPEGASADWLTKCAALDGKRFKLIEMKPGENAPPMHPNDRCCIIPVIEKKEEDLTLPKNSGNIKVPEEKIYIGRSVGAMAKNYPVKDPDSRQHYKFAEGTVISKVKVIMGDGTNKPLSEKYKIALRNGIKNPNLIKKFRGEGFVIANGIIKKAELHWYEAENKKFEFKIKRYFK